MVFIIYTRAIYTIAAIAMQNDGRVHQDTEASHEALSATLVKCRGIDPDKIAVALNNGKKEPGQLWRRLGVKILIQYDTILLLLYTYLHVYIYIYNIIYFIYVI